jgi:hypothetical protein
MFELHLKADGPMEQAIMSLFDELKAVLSDTANLSAEAAEIRTAFDGFKANAATLNETIQSLQSQLASGGVVTESQLAELLVLAKAKDAAITGLFTPDFVGTDPVPPVDPVVPSE